MRSSRALLPRVLTTYLVREFLGFFLPILLGLVALYLIVDLFERLEILLRSEASLGATARYFIFKIPLMVTQVLPPAVIVSMLLSLGNLCRRNEVAAFRAGGVSLSQTAFPLMLSALGISLLALAWNEWVVPYSTQHFQEINLVEIRHRERRSLLNDREVWYHGRNGFYNIDHVDTRKQNLYGVAIYRLDAKFALASVVQIDTAHWNGGRWEIEGGIEHHIDEEGRITSRTLAATDDVLSEKFDDFREVEREPEEMSYRALQDRIAELTEKGIDASNYSVDLNLKLAIPFTSLVLAAVAIPIAGRIRRHVSLATIVSSGACLGFSYWVILGLTSSLGQSAVIPAPLAAWSANLIFALIGSALFLFSE